MKYHPASYIFPMMTKDKFESLKESIKENGLIEKITTYEGKILDGRNRFEACREMGVKPEFEEWHKNGVETPEEFVFAKNFVRRDELTKSQIACSAAAHNQMTKMSSKDVAKMARDVNQGKAPMHARTSTTLYTDNKNIYKCARKFKVGYMLITKANTILLHAKDIFKDIQDGKIPLKKGYELYRARFGSRARSGAKEKSQANIIETKTELAPMIGSFDSYCSHIEIFKVIDEIMELGWKIEVKGGIEDDKKKWRVNFYGNGFLSWQNSWSDKPYECDFKKAAVCAAKERL